jgi:hypothetical protein
MRASGRPILLCYTRSAQGDEGGDVTRIHWLVPLVLGPPLAAAVALAALRPADASWTFAGALALLLAAGFAAAWRFGRRRPEWVVAGCAFSLVLWPEVALRALGLRFDEVGAIFGIWEPIAARAHPDFFWTLPPERPEVNAEGFPARTSLCPSRTASGACSSATRARSRVSAARRGAPRVGPRPTPGP